MRSRKTHVPRSIVAAVVFCLAASTASGTVPDPASPPLMDSVAMLFGVGYTQIPTALFWDSMPSASPTTLTRSVQDCAAKRAQGIMPSLMLMMWSDAHYNSEPGVGRTYSDKPGYTQYWRWNNTRSAYFARKQDNAIWSRNFEPDSTPKDAWITPSMPLDGLDQTATIKT